MVKPEKVLACGREIRAFLPELVGAEAPAVDQQLAALLAQAKAGESVDTEIVALLQRYPAAYQWAAEYLAPKRTSKGYEPLPGSSGAVAARKYVCAEGDYVWYRRSTGVAVPTCPTHGALIAADED